MSLLGLRYAKASDPDNWFTIDEETAEIKLNKKPDRESPFVVDGAYVAEIVAISKGTPANTTPFSNLVLTAFPPTCQHCLPVSSAKWSRKRLIYRLYVYELDGSHNGRVAQANCET